MIIRLRATLDHFAARQAVFALENGQELSIAKDDLAASYKEGDSFVVQVMPQSHADMQKEALARTLLNQLLQNDQEIPPASA